MISVPPDGNTRNVGVVIPAAGSGSRFGGEKQFKILGNREVIFHSLSVFLKMNSVLQVAIAVHRDRLDSFSKLINSVSPSERVIVVAGGARRQDSVSAALKALDSGAEIICIHDAARPFITCEMVAKSVDACRNYDGTVTAVPITDTLKIVKPGNVEIVGTRDRSDLWGAQTPQTFRREALEMALEYADRENISVTDESMLMEKLGLRVCVVPGSPENIKITRPEDWILAKALLRLKND